MSAVSSTSCFSNIIPFANFVTAFSPTPNNFIKFNFIKYQYLFDDDKDNCNTKYCHTCDIPGSRPVLPLLTPLIRWSSRRAKSPAFSIFLSDFFADRPFFMSTVVYGITVSRIDL